MKRPNNVVTRHTKSSKRKFLGVGASVVAAVAAVVAMLWQKFPAFPVADAPALSQTQPVNCQDSIPAGALRAVYRGMETLSKAGQIVEPYSNEITPKISETSSGACEMGLRWTRPPLLYGRTWRQYDIIAKWKRGAQQVKGPEVTSSNVTREKADAACFDDISKNPDILGLHRQDVPYVSVSSIALEGDVVCRARLDVMLDKDISPRYVQTNYSRLAFWHSAKAPSAPEGITGVKNISHISGVDFSYVRDAHDKCAAPYAVFNMVNNGAWLFHGQNSDGATVCFGMTSKRIDAKGDGRRVQTGILFVLGR